MTVPISIPSACDLAVELVADAQREDGPLLGRQFAQRAVEHRARLVVQEPPAGLRRTSALDAAFGQGLPRETGSASG
jgi:hypothetical protein